MKNRIAYMPLNTYPDAVPDEAVRAARALGDVLTLLPKDGRITVLTVKGEKELAGGGIAGILAAALMKRGIDAHAKEIALEERAIGGALQEAMLEVATEQTQKEALIAEGFKLGDVNYGVVVVAGGVAAGGVTVVDAGGTAGTGAIVVGATSVLFIVGVTVIDGD